MHAKGLKLDGSHPTLLYAYGGFNISLTPGFSVTTATWLYPAVEVTPFGKSNLARTVKWVSATFVTLLLAGLTKYIYG